jgi:hypothetical protein
MPKNRARKGAREGQILKRFHDKDIVKRWEAFRAAGSLTGDRVVTALLETLAGTDQWSDREEIVRSLGRIGDRRAIPQVRAAVGDPEINVRWAAAQALGLLGAREAAGDLIRLMREDEHELVRGSAARALGRIHHAPAVPALIEALSDKDRFVQSGATEALAEIDTPQAAAALRSEKAHVQGAWTWYIRKGEKSALPRMRKLLDKYAAQDEAEWAIGSGEPSLVEAAERWAKTHGTRVRAKQTPLKWGQDRERFVAPPEVAPEDDWLQKLQASGWLEDVAPTEGRRIRAALKKDAQSPADVLSPAGYDAECIEGSGSYRRWILSSYEKAAAGQVRFSLVKDVVDSEKGSSTVSFTIGRRRFSRTFAQPDDYVADGLHAFINKAVAATGEKRRFFELGTGDQTVALAFVRPAVFARARKLGLV